MALVMVGTDSCKSSGKMSKKQRKAEIEAAKKQLQPIINGTSTLSYDEQKRVVSEIMDKNLNDPVLNSMIVDAQQKLKSLLQEQTKLRDKKIDEARAKLYDLLLNKDNKSADELEKELKPIKAMELNDNEINELIGRLEDKIAQMRASGGTANLPVKTQLENAFNSIVTASLNGDLAGADNTIEKTMKLFSADDVPVLIIISREGSIVDYDKPTTIRRYLNLLKDTKANRNNIDAIMTDSNGKIKGLDLIKK
jgi:hypothetical protein